MSPRVFPNVCLSFIRLLFFLLYYIEQHHFEFFLSFHIFLKNSLTTSFGGAGSSSISIWFFFPSSATEFLCALPKIFVLSELVCFVFRIFLFFVSFLNIYFYCSSIDRNASVVSYLIPSHFSLDDVYCFPYLSTLIILSNFLTFLFNFLFQCTELSFSTFSPFELWYLVILLSSF